MSNLDIRMNFCTKSEDKSLKIFLTLASSALKFFTVTPPQSLLSSNQRGTHLTIHVESLMGKGGKRRDLVPSTINATRREYFFENDKIQSYF